MGTAKFSEFNTLSFDVIGTLIDFERGILERKRLLGNVILAGSVWTLAHNPAATGLPYTLHQIRDGRDLHEL